MRWLAVIMGAFVAVLLGYQALIWGGLVRPSDGITQRENNLVRAERYRYRQGPAPLVLAGSSLANNIATVGMGRDEVVNLAMSGGAAQTGLAILLAYGGEPGVVLVELNDTIDRSLDRELLDSLGGLGGLKALLPALRTEYRPVSVLVDALRQSGDDDANARGSFNARLRAQSVARVRAQLMRPLSAEEAAAFRREAALIRDQVTALEAAGWRVVLGDVPRDSELMATTRLTQVQAILSGTFPPDRYEWLATPPGGEWITRDGLHLVRDDARRFAGFLREQLAASAAGR